MAEHLETGRKGEDLALAHLRANKFTVLHRNWRPAPSYGPHARKLELDLVARKGDLLLFVEVKTRSLRDASPFSPADAFTPAKKSKLLKAAMLFLDQENLWDSQCRFDLITVTRHDDGTFSLERHENVLEFSRDQGAAGRGGNTHWQPW